MEQLKCFADQRHKAWCIHCRRTLGSVKANRDHVPTKKILREPYPPNLPVVETCEECNESFSLDEQYTVAFLSAVISGSVEPEDQIHPAGERILSVNESLRSRIDGARKSYQTLGGEARQLWQPEQDRIDRVILKNARGHAFYELGEPMADAPIQIWSRPLLTLSTSELRDFEDREGGFAVWPEVGSRMMQRLCSGEDLDGPWIVVQQGVYRYSVFVGDFIRVRSIIFDYLATEVSWAG